MSPVAESAWSAYLAMAESKRNYFSFLAELDQKYKQASGPGMAENLKLEQLLAEHNEKVKLFTRAMNLVTEVADREVLLQKMQQLIEGN